MFKENKGKKKERMLELNAVINLIHLFTNKILCLR